MNQPNLCREIGDFFGAYAEQGDTITVDTGEAIYSYSNHTEMLTDWIDTLIESQLSGGGTWEDEIIFIYSCLPTKHPIGIRCRNNKSGAVWKVSVDICSSQYPHGKSVYLGAYRSIVDAICARREYLTEIKNIALNTPEGFEAAIRKAKEKSLEAKKCRKF